MNNFIIFAGSTLPNIEFIRPFLESSPQIICADSGAQHAERLGVLPHIVVGDFDSIPPDLLNKYRALESVNVVEAHEQNAPDLEKALRLIPNNAEKISIFGALGGRLDHLFANILTLENHPNSNRFALYDEQHEIRLLTSDHSFTGKIGDKIGVVPLREIEALSYTGLRYPAESLAPPYNLGWLGTSNELSETSARIKINSGCAIFIHHKD